MTADITIKKGLDLPMTGEPTEQTRSVAAPTCVSVYPSEYKGFKFKLLVAEGDTVKRGTALAFHKKQEAFKLRSPAAGTVKTVVYGARRALQEIVIEVDASGEQESFASYTEARLLSTDRDELLAYLNDSGLMALVRQRPFNRIAHSDRLPKSIFVNAMNTAPFRPDAHVLIKNNKGRFQAGLNALTRLTDGPVHLCVDAGKRDLEDGINQAQNVQISYFKGPHPSGNTSTHIHALDPILPGDVVWTLRVSDVIRIGDMLTSGVYPNTQAVMIAGTGVKESARGYVTVATGAPLSTLFDGVLAEGEQRIIRGDTLAGDTTSLEDGVHFQDQGYVVLPEDRERILMGWYAPTTTQFSDHKVVPSAWVKDRKFSFGTSQRGSHRAMVLTGIYDKYVPLDIMVDPLARACIAKDTEEAIALGILETDPEDFALCTVVCPSKTDFGQIVANGLALIEEEGI